jgi:hypothetical protein
MAGARDEALPPEKPYDIATDAIGAEPAAVAGRAIRGAAGRLDRGINPQTGEPEWTLYFRRSLTPVQADRVVAHETGHAIDEIAGQIPTDGITRELERVYSTLHSGIERTRNLTRPQNWGYGPAEAPRELMAEAIRAYMADPNYLKTVAPNAAARIRAAVNGHPRLSRIIQFNTVGAGAVGGAAAARGLDLLAPLSSDDNGDGR